jgi:type III restriction enzyme
MSIRAVNAISGRLSLRPPQRTSLEILGRVCEIVKPSKQTDSKIALEIIRSEYPTVTDFERDFPSLCFALATGVGKTRLMGAVDGRVPPLPRQRRHQSAERAAADPRA